MCRRSPNSLDMRESYRCNKLKAATGTMTADLFWPRGNRQGNLAGHHGDFEFFPDASFRVMNVRDETCPQASLHRTEGREFGTRTRMMKCFKRGRGKTSVGSSMKMGTDDERNNCDNV